MFKDFPNKASKQWHLSLFDEPEKAILVKNLT